MVIKKGGSMKYKNNLVSFLIIIFIFNGCAVIYRPTSSIYFYIKSGLITSKVKNKELINFVDSLILNYNHYNFYIQKSELWDKEYSDSKFRPYLSDYFKQCLEIGYTITDAYLFKLKDQETIRYRVLNYHDIVERYPKPDSQEGKDVTEICNIHLALKDAKSNYHENSSDLVITFCHRKNNTWYFRMIGYEFY